MPPVPAANPMRRPASPTRPFRRNRPGFQALPGDRKVVLMWDHADDISIQGWEFRQKEADGRYGSWAAVPGSGADTTTHTVRDLENGTGICVSDSGVQRCRNRKAGRTKGPRRPMPAAPGKPTGFSVESGNRKAILTWTDPENETISKLAVRIQDDRRLRRLGRHGGKQRNNGSPYRCCA